jgi:hypothetical protein
MVPGAWPTSELPRRVDLEQRCGRSPAYSVVLHLDSSSTMTVRRPWALVSQVSTVVPQLDQPRITCVSGGVPTGSASSTGVGGGATTEPRWRPRRRRAIDRAASHHGSSSSSSSSANKQRNDGKRNALPSPSSRHHQIVSVLGLKQRLASGGGDDGRSSRP